MERLHARASVRPGREAQRAQPRAHHRKELAAEHAVRTVHLAPQVAFHELGLRDDG